MISGASCAVSTPLWRGVPSTTVGKVVIRWQELTTMTSRRAFATSRPWATSPSRTGKLASEAFRPVRDGGLERAVARRVGRQIDSGQVHRFILLNSYGMYAMQSISTLTPLLGAAAST